MTKEQRRRCFVISRLALKLTNWLSEEFKKSASRHSNEISFFGESFNCFLGIFPLFFGEKKERNEGGTHEQLLLQWGQQQQEFVFIRANSAISPSSHLLRGLQIELPSIDLSLWKKESRLRKMTPMRLSAIGRSATIDRHFYGRFLHMYLRHWDID